MIARRKNTAHVYANPSVELVAELSKLASSAGITRTAWVRVACKEYLAKPHEQPEKDRPPMALQTAVGQRQMMRVGVSDELRYEIHKSADQKGMKTTEWIIMAISEKMHKEVIRKNES